MIKELLLKNAQIKHGRSAETYVDICLIPAFGLVDLQHEHFLIRPLTLSCCLHLKHALDFRCYSQSFSCYLICAHTHVLIERNQTAVGWSASQSTAVTCRQQTVKRRLSSFHLLPAESPVRWVFMIKVQICFNYFRSMLAEATSETCV